MDFENVCGIRSRLSDSQVGLVTFWILVFMVGDGLRIVRANSYHIIISGFWLGSYYFTCHGAFMIRLVYCETSTSRMIEKMRYSPAHH